MKDEADADIAPGDRIDGRFRVVECLDRTPSARAFAVHDELYDQPTALALVDQKAGAERVSRFLREARAMAAVASPHAPKVYAVGELPGGAAYVAMEQFDGEDVGELMRAGGRLSVERAVDIALQALDALAFAHDGGVLHCEINPAALVVTSGPETLVKVVDFRFTTHARAGGVETLRYAAPEQVRGAGDAVDERADIYAVGAVLYELLCGVPAIAGTSREAIARNVLEAAPLPPYERRADVPHALSAVVMRCLAKSPAERFETVGDLAPALAPHGSGAFAHCVARAQIVLGTVPGMRGAWSRPPPPPPPMEEPPPEAVAAPVAFVPMSGSWPVASGSDRTAIVTRVPPSLLAATRKRSYAGSIIGVALGLACVAAFAGMRLSRRAPAATGHAPEMASSLFPAAAPSAPAPPPATVAPATTDVVAQPAASATSTASAPSARPVPPPAPPAPPPLDKRSILRDRH
jgi:serine/threonine protein kinase